MRLMNSKNDEIRSLQDRLSHLDQDTKNIAKILWKRYSKTRDMKEVVSDLLMDLAEQRCKDGKV